jgi:hypothetical protein
MTTPTMNLASPGSRYGPCQTDCIHPRCKRSRRAAATICRQCGQEIGYNVNHIADPAKAGALVHSKCQPDAVEQGR